MKFFSDVKTIIIFILFGVIIWLSQCNSGQPFISFGSDCPEIRDTVVRVTHDTLYPDTVYKQLIVEKPYPVEKVVPVQVPIQVTEFVTRGDSALIDSLLQAFYAQNIYGDTISDDSVEIYIEETVSENRIQERKVGYRLLFPVISTTKSTLLNYVHKRRNQFYLGGVFGPAFPNEVGFQYGLKATFVGKKNYMIGATYSRVQSADLNTNFLLVEYSRLITFRRKGKK
jgi:hypothetical protein